MIDRKRAFDVFCVGVAALIVVPLGVLSYPILRLLIGKPIVFKQKRVGKNGKVFVMYKLRSMYKNAPETKNKYLAKNEAPAPMFKIANDPRFLQKKIQLPFLKKTIVLKVGRYLSQSGLDEIPQLFNVLKGEMSIVGPRPEAEESYQKISRQIPEFAYRTRMKAGITGLAQIYGKYNTSPQEKLKFDLFYIENFTIWLDIKLIFQTISVFFKKDSVEMNREKKKVSK